MQSAGNKLHAEDETVRARPREVKARFVSHRLAGFGRAERPGILVLWHRCSAARAKLLAAGEDDLGLQIYR